MPRGVLEAKIGALEAKIDKSQSQLQVLIEKNHSETMLKFAELDSRLSRIEGERRIVQ